MNRGRGGVNKEQYVRENIWLEIIFSVSTYWWEQSKHFGTSGDVSTKGIDGDTKCCFCQNMRQHLGQLSNVDVRF